MSRFFTILKLSDEDDAIKQAHIDTITAEAAMFFIFFGIFKILCCKDN
jgi:hypothetical protein